jgi:hypothetical protein
MTRLLLLKWLSTLLLAIAIAPAAAPANPNRATVIVTANTHPLYLPMTDDPRAQAAPARFEEELRALRLANPDAYHVDAGNFLSLGMAFETTYSFTAHRALRSAGGADAIVLSARDAAFSIVSSGGYRNEFDPDKQREDLVTNLEAASHASHGRPAVKMLAPRAAAPLAVVSAVSPRAASGALGVIQQLVPMPPDRLTGPAAEARRAGAIVLGVTSMEPREWKDLFGAVAGSAPDVMVDYHATGTLPLREGSTWVVAPPALGSILVLDLERDPAGGVRQPRTRTVDYGGGLTFADFYRHPVPATGIRIPNTQNVLETFMPEFARERIREDIIPPLAADVVGRLTTVSSPSVYHLSTPGGTLRLYRLTSQMPAYRNNAVVQGWPYIDMVVVLREDGTLDRVLNRSSFPIGFLPSTLLESLNALAGRPMEQWQPDPVLAAGVEEVWAGLTDHIRRVIELDRLLYGPDSPYRSNR